MCIFANLSTIGFRLSYKDWSLMAILQSTTDMLVDQSISPISIRMQYWKLPEVSHQIDIG